MLGSQILVIWVCVIAPGVMGPLIGWGYGAVPYLEKLEIVSFRSILVFYLIWGKGAAGYLGLLAIKLLSNAGGNGAAPSLSAIRMYQYM